jgi:hypothetical protein
MSIKKRVIAGVAVGTAVFGGVFGLAAGLDVSSGDKIGSGQASVTSCDLDGVTTSYVFDGASNVTAISVYGIADDCDQATVSVAGSSSYPDSSINTPSSVPSAPLVSGSALLTTYVFDENNANNSITVPLDTPMNAQLFNVVTVTLHGGHAPVQLLPN